jgi:Integrase core domain/GAG-pre-integrase domain
MINCKSGFTNITKQNHSQNVFLADGSTTPILGCGQVKLFNKPVDNVLYLLNFSANLLFVGKITKELNCNVIFSPSSVIFQDIVTGKTIGEGNLERGLYIIKDQNYAFTSFKNSLNNLWHWRMGHPSDRVLNKIIALSNLNSSYCEICNFAKQTKLPFSLSNNRSDKPFQIIHSDVWGPAPIESYDNFKYFVTFIDDFSRATWLYLLNSKAKVFSIFKEFVNLVSTQYNTQVKILRTDNGTEYVNKNFRNFLNDSRIIHQTTCVGTPEKKWHF